MSLHPFSRSHWHVVSEKLGVKFVRFSEHPPLVRITNQKCSIESITRQHAQNFKVIFCRAAVFNKSEEVDDKWSPGGSMAQWFTNVADASRRVRRVT